MGKDCSTCGGYGFDPNPLNDPGPCPECGGVDEGVGYIPGDLRQCSRILRDDTALRDDLGNGRLAEGRMLVSVSQELWNNWCAAIGDRA